MSVIKEDDVQNIDSRNQKKLYYVVQVLVIIIKKWLTKSEQPGDL